MTAKMLILNRPNLHALSYLRLIARPVVLDPVSREGPGIHACGFGHLNTAGLFVYGEV